MIPGLIYWGVHNSLSPADQLISIRTAYCGPLRDEWLNIIGICLQIFYIRLAYKTIQNFVSKAKHTLSNVDKVEIKWVQFMLTSFFSIAIVYISLCILINNKRIIDLVTILSFDLFFFLIFVKHLVHPPDYKYFSQLSILAEETIHSGNNSSIRYKGFRMREDEINNLNFRLLSIMENKKPYLNSELSLSGLADMLNTTTHRLSFVINTTMEMNYFDFINSYRIKEAMNLLQTAQEIDSKIVAIAFDSGFNNRTSFHLAFKKFTGLTPKEYREKQVKVTV
jgi:AraC-like DNA-binding protein